MQEYTKTDQHLHLLSQVIAKVNRTYVPVKDDDSHTNLFFDSIGNRITGRWIHSEFGNILPSFYLNSQTFEFLDTSFNVLASVTSISKRVNEIEKEIETLLPELGLNPEGFTAKLHFEIPHYEFADHSILPLDSEGLQLWKKYRSMANETCFSLLGYAQAHEEVRIWPHHFDTGIYFKVKNNLGIGLGLAMEDNIAGAPYFYMSAYPEGRDIEYKNLPEGHWKWEISAKWKGAILTLDELEKQDSNGNRELAFAFIKDVYNWIIAQ